MTRFNFKIISYLKFYVCSFHLLNCGQAGLLYLTSRFWFPGVRAYSIINFRFLWSKLVNFARNPPLRGHMLLLTDSSTARFHVAVPCNFLFEFLKLVSKNQIKQARAEINKSSYYILWANSYERSRQVSTLSAANSLLLIFVSSLS